MIILGDKNIPYDHIEIIKSIDDIKSTLPNSIVLFEYDIDILKYCYKNNINTMVKINSIVDGLYANSLNSYYILVDETIAYDMQQIAQNYMFDSKIIQLIDNTDQMEKIAKNNIDGVVFKNILKGLDI